MVCGEAGSLGFQTSCTEAFGLLQVGQRGFKHRLRAILDINFFDINFNFVRDFVRPPIEYFLGLCCEI